MRRREFITILSNAAAAWPLAARAQKKLPVLAFLNLRPEQDDGGMLNTVRASLKESGLDESRDFAFEYRWADFGPDRLDRIVANAADLVQRGPAAIITFTTADALVVKAATGSIPIIFWIGTDPFAMGLVKSFNRPGDNLTGCYNLNTDLTDKRIEILHEMVPSARFIAFFVNPVNKGLADAEIARVEVATRGVDVRILPLNVSSPDDFETAFVTARERASASIMGSDSLFYRSRKQLVELAARYSMPTIYASSESVIAGGLVSFGTRYSDGWRIVANYAGRILKGEKPSDLPVQQITKTELVINLKAAKALALTVPARLLVRADEVIE